MTTPESPKLVSKTTVEAAPALAIHPKVTAALLATWITLLVVYSLHQWAHTDLPGVAATALTGVIAFAAGWLAPSHFS